MESCAYEKPVLTPSLEGKGDEGWAFQEASFSPSEGSGLQEQGLQEQGLQDLALQKHELQWLRPQS